MTPQHARRIQTMTYAEYLFAEDHSLLKHEYLQGDVWAMSGGTIEHGGLAAAMGGELRQALAAAGKPCRVYSSDVRVRVAPADLSTYPDVSVVCGPVETEPYDRQAITNPVLLVEVLSPSTEEYDRGQKFAYYEQLPSLQVYVLVWQTKPHIEVYERTVTGWALREASAGERIDIPLLGITLDVDAVYANPAEVG